MKAFQTQFFRRARSALSNGHLHQMTDVIQRDDVTYGQVTINKKKHEIIGLETVSILRKIRYDMNHDRGFQWNSSSRIVTGV